MAVYVHRDSDMEFFYKKIIYNINFALNKIKICLSRADIDSWASEPPVNIGAG